MNFQQFGNVIYHLVIFCLVVDDVPAQNVKIGDAGLQPGIQGQINCTYDDGVIVAVYWKIGEKGDTIIVPGNNIIQYTIVNGITIPDPANEGRYNMTSDYGLIITEVTMADVDLRYWCQANIETRTGRDSADGYEVRPKTAAILKPECSDNCKDGDKVVCEVNGFTPADEFDIEWTVGGALDPSGIVKITPSKDVFNASSTFEIKGTNLYTCEPTGKAFKYAADGEYGDRININSTSIPPTVPGITSQKTESHGPSETSTNEPSDIPTTKLPPNTGKPDALRNVRVTASTLSSLTVEWDPGYDGGEDQSFLVAYRIYPDGVIGNEEMQSGTIHTLIGLIPGKQYEIVVYSQNIRGRSENGFSVVHRTRQIPDPPISVKILDDITTVNSLTVTWVPGYDGGDPQWFLVDHAKQGGQFGRNMQNLSDSRNVTQHEITGLSPGTAYVVVVYSENLNGINEEGKTDSATTSTEPSRGGLSSGAIYAIIGSVVGTLLLLIIIALSVYPRKQTEGEGTFPLKETSNGNGRGRNTFSSTNNEIGTGPTYAAVDKTKKSKTKAPTYAAVKESKNTDQAEECAYDDVAKRNPTSNRTQSDDGKAVNPDGLIYQEVGHFKSHPVDAPPIQTEASTEYASDDLNLLPEILNLQSGEFYIKAKN